MLLNDCYGPRKLSVNAASQVAQFLYQVAILLNYKIILLAYRRSGWDGHWVGWGGVGGGKKPWL